MLNAITFDLAYRKYSVALHGASRRITNGSADAEDVSQEAWIEAWKSRDNLELHGLWSWLCTVVRRCWWKRLHPLKSDAKREALPQHEEFDIDRHDIEVEPVQEIAGEAIILEKAIDGLTVPWIASNGRPYDRPVSKTMKTTMHLYAKTGNKSEVARIRGMTENNVTGVINRAVEALRKKWGLT